MQMDEPTWFLIRETPGVGDFIGAHGKPEPMAQEEVDKLLGQVEKETEKPRIKIEFQKGDAVKIKEGPFENYDGVIDEVDAKKGTVRVIITVFNRPTSVELGYWQVEAI
jgi:transcriptional antiterminator NusG